MLSILVVTIFLVWCIYSGVTFGLIMVPINGALGWFVGELATRLW